MGWFGPGPMLAACTALVAAAAIHGLFRVAEAWEARRRGRSRDMVMLPALLMLVLAVAWVADRLGEWDAGLLRQCGFALFLGLAIGQRLPRPPRRR